MSTTTTKISTASKSKPPKRRNVKASPPPLKVLVRRLPHEITEEKVVSALTAAATEAGLGERGGCWDVLYVAPGKTSKKRGRVSGTAYLRIDRGRGMIADLRLVKLRAAVQMSEALMGHAVASTKDKSGDKGAQGPMVEPAPFQKLFRTKPKRDARVGTIDKDPDYKAFCAALGKPQTRLVSADIQADNQQAETKDQPKQSNALLDYLKERSVKRGREYQRGTSSSGNAASSSRGGKRVSSRSTGGGSGGGSAALALSSGESSEVLGAGAGTLAVTSTAQGTTGTSGSASKRHGAETSRAPAGDNSKPKPKDAERERAKGRPPRGSSSLSRVPPLSASQKSASLPSPLPSVREEDSTSADSVKAPLKSSGPPASGSNADSSKSRSSSRGGARASSKSTRAAASGVGNTGNLTASRPAAILMKQKDTAILVAVSTVPEAAPVSDASGSSSGGGGTWVAGKGDSAVAPARGGRGRGAGNGGGGRGRTSGNPSRAKGAGGNGGS